MTPDPISPVELFSAPAVVARILFAAAVATIGCATPRSEAKLVEATTDVSVSKAAAPMPVAPGCSSERDCRDGQLCIRSNCVDISLGLAECQMCRVHFGFNAIDFEPESKDDLARIARCLRADQALRLNIEGNADERGTEEYNLQLGSKRASSVENYLLALGVTPSQVKTVSYGENKPLCSVQDEECWAKNRRASVKPTENPTRKKK